MKHRHKMILRFVWWALTHPSQFCFAASLTYSEWLESKRNEEGK